MFLAFSTHAHDHIIELVFTLICVLLWQIQIQWLFLIVWFKSSINLRMNAKRTVKTGFMMQSNTWAEMPKHLGHPLWRARGKLIDKKRNYYIPVDPPPALMSGMGGSLGPDCIIYPRTRSRVEVLCWMTHSGSAYTNSEGPHRIYRFGFWTITYGVLRV